MRLLLIGPPGGGKGTQAKFLIDRFAIPQISTGDMLRGNTNNNTPMGKEAQNYMNSGQLVPDSIILDMMQKRLTEQDCKNGYILDGFPRTIPQAEGLNYLLKGVNQQLDHVIVMDVPDNLIITRLSNRRSCKECSEELYLREDDNPATIQQRLTIYHQQTKPVINYYSSQKLTKVIDSHGTIDEIRLDILKNINS